MMAWFCPLYFDIEYPFIHVPQEKNPLKYGWVASLIAYLKLKATEILILKQPSGFLNS